MSGEGDVEACPACGSRRWATDSAGVGDVASIVAVCVSCHYVTSSTVDDLGQNTTESARVVTRLTERCPVRGEAHPTMPHLVEECAREKGHDGDHCSLLHKTRAEAGAHHTPAPTPDDAEGKG